MTMFYLIERGTTWDTFIAIPKDLVRVVRRSEDNGTYMLSVELDPDREIGIGVADGWMSDDPVAPFRPISMVAQQMFIDIVDCHVDLDVTWIRIDEANKRGYWKRTNGRPSLMPDKP